MCSFYDLYDVNKLSLHPNFTFEKIKEINKWYDDNKGHTSQKIPYNYRKITLENFKKEYKK